jgi:hypothetical protein
MQPMKPMEWTPLAEMAQWWPSVLGTPSTSGAQNGCKYAYFREPRRLVIEHGGETTTYDTAGHHIGGVAQQQGGDARSLTFTSQDGTVRLDELDKVD